MTPLTLLACMALVSISAFLSSSETALFSLSRFQLRSLKERSQTAYRKIRQLLLDPGGLLITILVLNEIMNIALSTLVANAVSAGWELQAYTTLKRIHQTFFPQVPQWAVQTLLGTLITTPILLFFCEITPKAIGARANQMIALISSGPMSWIYESARPIRSTLKRIGRLFSRLLRRGTKGEAAEAEILLREKEYLSMIEEGHREGEIHESELSLIRNVFLLDDRSVRDLYTPIQRVHSLPAHTTLKAALNHFKTVRFSRVPVTSENRRQIVGILYSKDLLLARLSEDIENVKIDTLMRRPFVVHPGLKLNSLFRRLKEHRTHIAVVEGRPGEALGIVTMNDILDELFEDILDEETGDIQMPRGTER